MNFSPYFNYHSFSKIYPNNNQFSNLRYTPKELHINPKINELFPKNEASKSGDNDSFNKLTNDQLNSLKLCNFISNNKIKDKDSEEVDNYDKSLFIPINELLNKDFEKLAKSDNFISLKKYLPQMIFQTYQNKDLPNPNNSHLKLVLLKYQQSLKYLSNLEKKIEHFNLLMENHTKDIINNELTNYGKEKILNTKIEINEKKIANLLQKINGYKNIIIASKNSKIRTLTSFVLIIKDKDNNFFCDLCPNEIFQSYQEVQKHSLKKHEHILKLRKKNYEQNNSITSSKNNFEHNYIDTQMKYIKEELNTFIGNLEINNVEEIKLKNNNDISNEDKEEKKEIEDDGINNKNYMIIEKKINIIEENQKKNHEMLLDNLNEFKKEIFSQIQNIKNNQSIIIENTKSNYFKNEKNITSIDIKDKNIENKENINNFELGEKYQETTILENYNNNINEEEKKQINQMEKKFNNVIPNIKEENNPNLLSSKNLNITEEKQNDNNKNQNKINLESINEPKFSINPINQLNPNLNNFTKKFTEREKKLFAHKNNGEEIYENYKILEDDEIGQNQISDKEDEYIQKLKDKYNLNQKDLSKSGYNNIINEIIQKNEDVENQNYKAYFKNIVSFLEINKDLNNSIIK